MALKERFYKDLDGNVVPVKIDVDAVERCRLLGVDLYNLQSIGALAADMIRFLRVIHCVLCPDDYKPGANQRAAFSAWFQRHTGDAGEQCVEAFIEALCDFFPTRLATMVRELNQAVGLATEAAWSRVQSEHEANCGALRVISVSIPDA